MQQSKLLFVFITVIIWATVIGGAAYSSIVYFPPYLSHLPESTNLINGPYGLHDEYFWGLIHPLLIISLVITLILNWKLPDRRKYVLIAAGIYALAIISTVVYFVPELKAFAESNLSKTTSAAEWLQRGQRWQYLSWVRGILMYCGFVMMLIALTKSRIETK